MSVSCRRLLTIVLGCAAAAPICHGQAACEAIPSAKLESVALYVQQKYRLSFNIRVTDKNISVVEGTCYRRITFTAVGDVQPGFALKFYLSPDARFLSKELLDSRTDPIAEEQQKNRAVIAALGQTKAPTLGRSEAAVTITMFSDFQCPFCKRQAEILRDEILRNNSDVRLVFRNLPLPMHSWSRSAAIAGACAATQSNEAFWSLYNFFFDHQSEMNSSNFAPKTIAYMQSQSGVSDQSFKECLGKQLSAALIDSDVGIAHDNNIEATPTLFVNGIRIDGLASTEQLRTLIRQLSKKQSPTIVASRPQNSVPTSLQ